MGLSTGSLTELYVHLRMTDDSEMDAESDEEEQQLEYPLDGKFKDEADRE